MKGLLVAFLQNILGTHLLLKRRSAPTRQNTYRYQRAVYTIIIKERHRRRTFIYLFRPVRRNVAPQVARLSSEVVEKQSKTLTSLKKVLPVVRLSYHNKIHTSDLGKALS